MSASDEESDNLADLEEIRDRILSQPRNERMQVSAWEDDDDGVEASRDAKAPDQRTILSAAENGNLENVKYALYGNYDLLNCTDKDGYTPLHRACYGNHVGTVKYLLQAGALVDAKSQNDWQPLHSAACWNNVDCMAALISHGANINARSKGDQTPLHLVCASSHNSASLQLLLLHPDLDHEVVNNGNDTAEAIARRTGKYYPMFEIVEDCLNKI